MNRPAFIVSAKRTPIGKFLGGLSNLPAPALAAPAIQSALQNSGIDAGAVEEVIFGNVVSAGIGQAPARQAALAAGIPAKTPAVTINKVCGSGLKAVMLADQAIRVGDAKIVVAGGMESMSRAPFLDVHLRSGAKFGHQQLLDALLHDGLFCSVEEKAMGCLADYTAQNWSITRQAQDQFAVESHRRASQAIQQGRFQTEIVPITVRGPNARGGGDQVVKTDEGPRDGTSFDSLARLKPAFGEGGSATAGNSSQLSDGAAALVVVDEQTAKEVGSPLKARIVASAADGENPRDLFIAPVGAIQKVLDKARLSLQNIDLVELNEAFASQCLACMGELDLSAEKVNVRGGAIALGHPIGASGARVLVTLLHSLKDHGLQFGLASLCLGGGNAVAMIVEMVP